MTISNDTLTTLPFLHANQPDRPNTVFASSLALKQAFDSSTIALQNAHNALIADLLATTSGASASESLGSAAIIGVSGSTIYNQLVDLKAQIQAIVGSSIPSGSITTAMIQDGAVTHQKLEVSEQTASVGGLMYAYTNFFGL